MSKQKSQASVDMRYIANGLKRAKQYKLEVEVIAWAMYALRANPKLSIGQAINEGLMEWDV